MLLNYGADNAIKKFFFGANTNNDNRNSLSIAVKFGHLGVFKILLSYGTIIGLTKEDYRIVLDATIEKNFDFIFTLITHVNEFGLNFLHRSNVESKKRLGKSEGEMQEIEGSLGSLSQDPEELGEMQEIEGSLGSLSQDPEELYQDPEELYVKDKQSIEDSELKLGTYEKTRKIVEDLLEKLNKEIKNNIPSSKEEEEKTQDQIKKIKSILEIDDLITSNLKEFKTVDEISGYNQNLFITNSLNLISIIIKEGNKENLDYYINSLKEGLEQEFYSKNAIENKKLKNKPLIEEENQLQQDFGEIDLEKEDKKKCDEYVFKKIKTILSNSVSYFEKNEKAQNLQINDFKNNEENQDSRIEKNLNFIKQKIEELTKPSNSVSEGNQKNLAGYYLKNI